jgi:hypothetical protein
VGAFVHLFFVDGNTCSVTDSYACLTPNQTVSFVMSDLDPGVTGYLIAIATDAAGCPIHFNALIGDAYIKFATGHSANLGAIAVPALPGLANLSCPNPNDSASTVVKFDGVSYAQLPRQLAISNLAARANGNDTILVLDRIGGNLSSNAAALGSIFGLLYDDAEKPFSFAFGATTCQFRAAISNNFPRTAPRFETIIPASRSGWMKLTSSDNGAIVGAALNFNAIAGNPANAAAAFNHGHNLHMLDFSATATLTIPVFPPSC